MAIRQLVPIEITLLGDGSSTTFVFPAQNLYQNGVGGANPPVANGTVPSAILVPNPPLAITSNTIDANGNITITFTAAPTNNVQYTFEVDLLYASGALTSASATPVPPSNIFASGTALTQTGGSLNVNITGGSSSNPATATYSNPAPAQGASTTLSVDLSGNLRTRNSSASTLGEQIAMPRQNQVEVNFSQGFNSALISNAVTGTGTATVANGTAVYSSGTTSGGRATGTSTQTLNYRPGHEWYCYFTAGFSTGGTGAGYQRIGPYNTTDGFYIGYEGSTFNFTQLQNGTATHLARSSWNGDPATGAAGSAFTSGGSPVALNLQNINIFRIHGAWFGVAPIYLDVLSPDGEWITLHTFRFPNTLTSPYAYTTNWNITVDVLSASATAVSITTPCWALGVVNQTPYGSGIYSAAAGSWTSATALNTAVNIPNASSANTVTVEFVQTSTITGGIAAFEASIDSTNWFPINAININSQTVQTNYSFQPSTLTSFIADITGWAYFRIRLSQVINGTGTVLVQFGTSPLNASVNQVFGNVAVYNMPATGYSGSAAPASFLETGAAYNAAGITVISGNAAPLQINSTGQLQTDPNYIIGAGFVPDPGNYGTTLTTSAVVDASGNLVTRSAVFTDEGSLRDDFSGTSLATTIGANITTTASSAIVTSASPEFGNGNGTGIKIGQYIKISSDPEADWTQLSYISSTTSGQLAANYPGTITTAAGQVSNWATKTGSGGSFTVANSVLTIASGTTASAFTGIIGTAGDYLPLLLQTYVQVSQRIANETVVFGFQDTLSSTPNYAAVVSLSGTTNTTGNFITQSSSAATDTQTTAFTYPLGTNSGTYHQYTVSLSANQATLLIDGVVVATNIIHVPGPYNAMQVVYYTLNGGSAPVSSTSLLVDYTYFIDSDRVQIDDDYIGEPLVVSAAIQQDNGQLTYSQGMPAQLQMDILGNLKVAENASLDSFGDIIHCVRNSQWQQDFSEGQNAALTALTGTTGTATYSNGSVTIATTAAASTSANLQSTFGMNYRVSHEWYFYFTATFTTGVANSHQRIGALTGIVNSPQNGVCVGFEGTTFGVSYFKAGTGQGSFAVNSAPSVARSAFNGDQCTGAAGSRFTQSGAPTALNLNNLNLYRLRGGWLGAASILLEVLSPDGNWVVMHTIVVPNQGTLPWTYATNWNYQAEVLNSTNATNIAMTMGGGAFGTTESIYTDNTSNTINITAADAASTTAVWANGQNAISGTPTANSTAVFPIVGASALRVQMSGTLVGTVVTEASTDGGQTWQAQYVHLTGTSSEASTFTGAASPNTNFEGSTIAAGFTHFRVRCTTFTSGTGTVLVRSTVNPASIEVIAPVFTEPWQNFTTGATWAAGTTNGTFQTIDSPGSGVQPQAYMVQLDQGSGISGGAITFQVTADGINWVTIPASCVIDPTTLLPITLPYTLVASTNRAFKVVLYGYTGLRLSVSTTTAGGSVTPYWATINSASISSPLGIYNSTIPTLTTGQQIAQQVDTAGSHYINAEGRKATYSASASVTTTSTTGFAQLIGSSTKTVRVLSVEVWISTSGTAAMETVTLSKYSAAASSTSGQVTATAVPQDSNYAAATAVASTFASGPTTAGTSIGAVRTARLFDTGTTAGPISYIRWTFGTEPGGSAIVLRGTAQSVVVALGAVISTQTIAVSFEWTEE